MIPFLFSVNKKENFIRYCAEGNNPQYNQENRKERNKTKKVDLKSLKHTQKTNDTQNQKEASIKVRLNNNFFPSCDIDFHLSPLALQIAVEDTNIKMLLLKIPLELLHEKKKLTCFLDVFLIFSPKRPTAPFSMHCSSSKDPLLSALPLL